MRGRGGGEFCCFRGFESFSSGWFDLGASAGGGFRCLGTAVGSELSMNSTIKVEWKS